MENGIGAGVGRASARAGLLGNPSDAYRGKAIAFSFGNFSARVLVEPAERWAISDERAKALQHAAVARFRAHTELDLPPLRISLTSDIPFQVGLAGSSAIVIATLRALADACNIELSPFDQSELALAVEVEDLGTAAGPMDRVIQAYEGVLSMDFTGDRRPAAYSGIEPSLLPPMCIGWDPRGGSASGGIHADVRARWDRGDATVRSAMAAFPTLVDEGLRALQRGDTETLRRCVDRNFDARARLFSIAERDREMIGIARSMGAAAKQCGSGGACLAVLPDEGRSAALIARYEDAGFRALRPTLESTT